MFKGFSEQTIDFLRLLRDNNNRAWFEANRGRYERELLNPMKELVTAMTPFMLELDPLLETEPRKLISRINRDIRFSHDKTPYRTNMWFAFKRASLDWKAEPTYYFEIFTDYYRYGMGFYQVRRETMDRLRAMIDNRHPEFQEIHALYSQQKTFEIAGERYKRVLKPDLPAELQDWYQRKELYFVCNRPIGPRLFSPGLIDDLMEGFRLLEPIYHFLLALAGQTVH